jgi:DNA-binding MarR family transcriptional regulator
MKSRTIKHKGIDITMNIDMEALRQKMIVPFKEDISVLHKTISNRDKYIKKLHTQLRNRENTMFGVYASYKIYLATTKDISLKRLLILSYLYNADYAKPEIMTKYLKQIGVGTTCSVLDTEALEKLRYIKRSGNTKFYYITDDGKQKIDTIHNLVKSSMTYFMQNKKIRNVKNVTRYGESTRKSCFSDEQKEARRVWYRKMMLPFWDSKMKTIPKNKEYRVRILADWMQLQYNEGKEVDPLYVEYLSKWSLM